MAAQVDESTYQKQADLVKEIFNRTLQEIAPEKLVRDTVDVRSDGIAINDEFYPLLKNQRVWVFGSGKASTRMALALEQMLNDHLKDGIVITEHGNTTNTHIIQQFEASHPIPERDSESATYEFLNLADKVPADDLVIYCLSGGTSSLLCMPALGLELEDLQETHQQLINSGADIHEINVVRKHLSKVKGGQLLNHFKDTRLVDLVISDVPGDDLESIGSGPTTPDSSTFEEAFQILKSRRIWEQVPHPVRTHIAKGMHHEIPDTPKPGSDVLVKHKTHIVGSARKAAERAVSIAEEKGFNTWVDDEAYSDEVTEVSKDITEQTVNVLEHDEPVKKPAALIFYGESTVHVRGNGLGGRNQELALHTALGIDGHHYITLLSAGTDGRDGPTDAAGALSNGETVSKSRQKGVEPETYLENNDSYNYFSALQQLLKTGPTGNNVMDLQVVLVEN